MNHLRRVNRTHVFSFVLLCICIVAFCVISASAATYSGKCGDNLTYTLNTDTGVLTISGTGAMADWSDSNGNVAPWYDYCSSIRTAQVSKAATSIGAYAFYGCGSLTSITIPNRVTSIGASAFKGCSSLTSISLSSGVTSIGSEAFYGCNSLTSITIPNRVTSIGASAFYGCSRLTSISIPSGVTSIGASAFEDCSRLTSISIPSGVTSIGASAFEDCSRLTSISIPSGVTSIGASAFHGCGSLTSISIPSGVTSIGASAFYGCSRLNAVYITDIAAWCGIAFGNATANPLLYAHNLYLNGELATDLVIPSGVTSIGASAFKGCGSLTSISIPSGVTSIGASAFFGCGSLNAVYITDIAAWCGIAFGDVFANPLFCAHILYLNGELATDLVIPSGVTSIGASAFKGCSLTSISIPSGVTSIGASAFEDCRSLTSISIPSGVTSIGASAFKGCSRLTSISIPSGVTSIGASAFKGCSRLTSITIPDSVTSIGDSAFRDCSSLASITILNPNCQIGDSTSTIPSTATIYGYTGSPAAAYAKKYGCTFVSIGGNCGENLTFRMDYDTGILSIIGIGAMDSWYLDDSPWYAYRTSIRSIQIASGATSIGDFAFDGCSNLVDVVIAETVESIGEGAFDNCTSLAEVTILNDTCKIPDSADVFPASVTIYGKAGSTAEAYAKQYNRTFKQIGHTHVYAEDYTVDVPATCTTAGAKSRHCTVEGCTETIDSTVIPAAGHKFGAWTIIREATLDDTGERTHTCEVCGTTETETTPRRVRGDADGDGAVTIRDALLVLRAVLDGAAVNPYMDANGDGKLMLADVLLILRLAA